MIVSCYTQSGTIIFLLKRKS